MMDQHARANILIPFYHLFPLEAFSSEILGKMHVDEKDLICNGEIKKIPWMTVINGGDGDEGKCGAMRPAAALRRLYKEIFFNTMAHNAATSATSPFGDVADYLD